MSDKSDELKDTAVPTEDQIDTLKNEEKQKLTAAEEAYKKRQTAGANGTGSRSSAAVEQAAADRQLDHEQSRDIPWLPGVILIGLGLIFLLNNFTGYELQNWWALFILIPAVGSFSKAADIMRAEDGFTRQAWGAVAGGLILSLVTAAFLFDLDWGMIWSVFLIIGGMGLFLGGLRSR
jgi:hypothetical protein